MNKMFIKHITPTQKLLTPHSPAAALDLHPCKGREKDKRCGLLGVQKKFVRPTKTFSSC